MIKLAESFNDPIIRSIDQSINQSINQSRFDAVVVDLQEVMQSAAADDDARRICAEAASIPVVASRSHVSLAVFTISVTSLLVTNFFFL